MDIFVQEKKSKKNPKKKNPDFLCSKNGKKYPKNVQKNIQKKIQKKSNKKLEFFSDFLNGRSSSLFSFKQSTNLA